MSENATLETHHIDVIPARARHGKPWQQFAFWWGINVNVFNLVLGAVVVEIGLSFWWALIAIGVGTAVGALLIGLQPPRDRSSGCRRRSSRAASSGSTGPPSCSRACCC